MLINRLSFKFSGEYLKKEIHQVSQRIPTRPNYNMVRGDRSFVLNRDKGEWQVSDMVWGFGVDRSAEQRIINARAEGILAQPSFRFSIRERRVVIPTDSFYIETIRDQKSRVYRVVPFNDGVMYMAGIWEPLDQKTNGYAIMTVKSNRDVIKITDRMPLIFFDSESARNWCEPMNVNQILDWLSSTSSGRLKFYQVGEQLLHGANAPVVHEPIQEHLTLFD